MLGKLKYEVKKQSPVLAESLEHGARVAAYAKVLFYALAPLHALPKKYARILELGAKLHDIGWLEGKKAHHKNSAAMIRAGKIRLENAFELPLPYAVPAQIRPLVALVARYHRRSEPSPQQKHFAALTVPEQKAMLYLASIIRLADALDFSHTGAVEKLKVMLHSRHISLELIGTKACQIEADRVNIKKELFCKVFKLDVVCSCTKAR